ncbi:MAG: CRISPR-associated endonuclease Cas1 [Syntrophomonadaceae bacterium]|nr:CRISPR-associated endonuclease Cas1 [Bacillota bacterium]
MNDLQLLPKVRDSLSFLYLEHCKIEQDEKSVAAYNAEGKTSIPCASLSLLMLGPGTSVTHAAVTALADNGCLVLWTGEQGIRMYAQGMGESRSSANLIRQAYALSSPSLRMQVVRRMYEMRFPEKLPPELTLQQIRGKEGIRVRESYAVSSRETGVPWHGRNYNRKDWGQADPVNRALSCANSALYGVCHAAIVSLGYSPGLGFIHTGKQLSFVYDIADLYKADVTIPLAFRVAKATIKNIERETRVACRDVFHSTRLLGKIAADLDRLFAIVSVADGDVAADSDPALPGYLWDGGAPVKGGTNYSFPSEDDEGW